jgi:hypothetical protein
MVDGSNTKALGRLAGLAYLTIIVFSSFGYLTMTGLLQGAPGAAASRLAMNPTLFVLALAASVIGLAAWALVGLLIYRLTRSAGRIAGLAMLVFVAAGIATNLAALAQLLPLAGGGIEADRLALMVASYNRILVLAQVFSGLWLFPFGWLVARSRIAPRLLGLCLMLGGFGYLSIYANSVAPGLQHIAAYTLVGAVFGVAVLIGEAGICLWLLIIGAREPSGPQPLLKWSTARADPQAPPRPAPSPKT